MPTESEVATAGQERTIARMPALASNVPSSIAAGYVTSDGFDELVGAGGAIAPHWLPVLDGLESLSHAERLDRIDRINMRVRETGIAHDLFADPSLTPQPWRLDLMPLVIAADTWRTIERAVIQRARLLEALLADIYGPQTLMKSGLVPARLVFSDPAYLRACKGITPESSRIQFFAVDFARRPDGGWQVMDTHAETPAGIGYALANRMIMTHVLGDLFNATKATRLASYFQQMQDSLARRLNRPDPSIALLTPGPRHNDFFSHAYLARYLGFLLVEGGDLRVDHDRVYLKTLDGLQPIDLVVRCVAGFSCDALELDPGGFLGPVGLVQAVRQQPDLVVNALGTALAENRGLSGYLPALCKELLGEDLAIWDTQKWWLGDPAIRPQVVRDLDQYVVRPAYEQTARPGRAAPARDPSVLSSTQREQLIREIEIEGTGLVAERKSVLGTTPSYGPGGLEATPYGMRVFATAGHNGFIVMPGGLAMTVQSGTSLALSSPDGASRDVWVVSDKAQPAYQSLWRPTIEAAQIQRAPRELPSRAADNLFWLGRYIETADWTFRVLRNCLSRIEEDNGSRQNLRLMRAALNNLLQRDGAPPIALPPGIDAAEQVARLARALMDSNDRTHGLAQTLNQIHRVASQTRDRLSLEAWRTLNAFYVAGRWQPDRLPNSISEQLDLIDAGLGVVAAFNGLTHENMTRNFGWSFLDMGRRIARAFDLAQLLLVAFGTAEREADDSASLLFVLDLADSFITYRSRYRLNPMLPLVLDLLIVDETNPRSIAFQLAALSSHIDALPQTGKGRGRTEVQRTALAMVSDVRLADVVSLAKPDKQGQRSALVALLGGECERLSHLSDAITRRYFSVVEKEPMWIRARSRRER
jgi:uncharacterized circularly permuted ATP-grasp superfamily protein/uncharacterized alpha-E superfamily protein